MAGTVLFDKEDAELVGRYKWHISDTGYVVWRGIQDGKKQTVRMHRLIVGAKADEIVDHKNRDKLDNRRINLRIVTASQNAANKELKGYAWDKSKSRWIVQYKRQFYGRYDTEAEAQRAYQLACSGVPYVKRERRINYQFPTGVFRNKRTKLYQARIQIDGVRNYLGTFPTIDEAEKAYLNMKERV